MSRPTTPAVQILKMLPVLDQAGNRLFWADEGQARQLIREGKVELLGTKRRIRALRLDGHHPAAPGPAKLRGTRYSHNRETRENPQGCWTLIRIPDLCEDLFTAVRDQCLKRAA